MSKDVVSLLHTLVQNDGIEGVEVLQRDGQCLHEVFRPELDIPSYSMGSAMLTAASETVLPQLRFSPDGAIVTEAEDKKVVVVQANENLILAALASADRESEELVGILEKVAPQVTRLVARGGRTSAA